MNYLICRKKVKAYYLGRDTIILDKSIFGSWNGNIIIIDLNKGELEEIYEDVHTTSVVACEWQPRGNKFASIDNLGGLYIWGN